MKMKKLVLTTIFSALAVLMITGNAQAQKKYVNKAVMWAESGEKLDTALNAIKYAETQEKTKDWYKTYYAKGLVYQAIAKTDNAEFKKLSEQPLSDAYDNFAKAYNMKGSGSLKGSMDKTFIDIANELVNKGVEGFQKEDYELAFNCFVKALEVKQNEVFGGVIDTAVIFNAAMMADRTNKFDEATKLYQKTIEYNYGEGDTYYYLAVTYKKKGDTETYINTLKTGFEKYPSSQLLLGEIINYYLLETDNADAAFKYLALARENDPSNPQFYQAEAQLYDKIGDKEKAKVMYQKAIDLDPNFYLAYYNLGVLYFNEAVNLTDKANLITDNKKYEEAKKIADDKFIESLPYLEKSYELKPDESSIASTLKTLYYRLKMNDKYEEISKKME